MSCPARVLVRGRANVAHRASRVDVKKLEKQEAKLKVCVCESVWGNDDPLGTGQDRETGAARSVRGVQAARSASQAGASLLMPVTSPPKDVTCAAKLRGNVYEGGTVGYRVPIRV